MSVLAAQRRQRVGLTIMESSAKKGMIIRVINTISNSGFSGLATVVIDYLKYHIREKWRFVYFELDLSEQLYSLPEADSSLVIRRAVQSDIQKIRKNIYPYMTKKQEFDKRFINLIGKGSAEFIIAERDKIIVHYCVVFNQALDSPLMQMPFYKNNIRSDDAYMGSAFTVPGARGMWIFPHVLLYIVAYLKNNTDAKRVLFLVHEDTPGGTGFFKRLGFKVIENATSGKSW